MIVRLELEAENPIVLPKFFNHILQGIFYSHLSPDISTELHNHGIQTNDTFSYYKMFTYSKIIGKKLNKNDTQIIFDKNIRIYYAFAIPDIRDNFFTSILKVPHINIGNNKVQIKSIKTIKIKIYNNMNVKCLSPIVCKKTENNKTIFHNPYDDAFYEALIANLKNKFKSFYSKNYEDKIEISPLGNGFHKKKILYKKVPFIAWDGLLNIKASREMMRLLFSAGLGHHNAAGFGMVVPEEMNV